MFKLKKKTGQNDEEIVISQKPNSEDKIDDTSIITLTWKSFCEEFSQNNFFFFRFFEKQDASAVLSRKNC